MSIELSFEEQEDLSEIRALKKKVARLESALADEFKRADRFARALEELFRNSSNALAAERAQTDKLAQAVKEFVETVGNDLDDGYAKYDFANLRAALSDWRTARGAK